MSFAPGDRVHFAGLGTGTIIESRGADRYAVDIRGKVVVASSNQLEPAESKRRQRSPERTDSRVQPATATGTLSLDLHGRTMAEATELVERLVNDALLAGHVEARIVHGRSGGKVKAAAHAVLRRLADVAAFRLDPDNPGVTIVTFK
jgi:dsDNA-specific endonuclease/ATPase MutS2